MFVSDAVVKQDDDTWVFLWPDGEQPLCNISIIADRLQASSSGLTVTMRMLYREGQSARNILAPTRFNLEAPTTASSLAKMMAERMKEGAPNMVQEVWAQMLEQLRVRIYNDYHVGEPFQALEDIEAYEEIPDCVQGLITHNQTNVLIADGGKGKGILACYLTLCYATQTPFLGTHSIDTKGRPNALYVDYEDEAAVFGMRMNYISAGMGIEIPQRRIFYRRTTDILSHDLPQIKRMIADLNIGWVVVDSIAPAAGGNILSVETAMPVMNAMRLMAKPGHPVNRLAIGHVSKATARGDFKGNATIYGNAFFGNLARSVWELNTENDLPPFRSALTHTKSNAARRAKLGYEWDISDSLHTTTFEACDPYTVQGVSEKSSTAEMIIHLLKTEGPHNIDELAAVIDDKKPDTIRVAADRLVKKGSVVKLERGRWAMADLRYSS